MSRATVVFAIMLLACSPAAAQDIRGLEICTAEKQMDRRTSCLQSNVEFLQQAMQKSAADAQQKLSAVSAQLSAANAQLAVANKEIAALKEALAKLTARAEELEKKK